MDCLQLAIRCNTLVSCVHVSCRCWTESSVIDGEGERECWGGAQGLDPASRRNLWDVVKTAKRDRGIILTTHSMEEAEVSFMHAQHLHWPNAASTFVPCSVLHATVGH